LVMLREAAILRTTADELLVRGARFGNRSITPVISKMKQSLDSMIESSTHQRKQTDRKCGEAAIKHVFIRRSKNNSSDWCI